MWRGSDWWWSDAFDGRSLAFADGQRYSFYGWLYLADGRMQSTRSSSRQLKSGEVRGGRSGLNVSWAEGLRARWVRVLAVVVHSSAIACGMISTKGMVLGIADAGSVGRLRCLVGDFGVG